MYLDTSEWTRVWSEGTTTVREEEDPEGAGARERKPRAPGRQNDQKANFIHYFHFNATVSQFMGGPGFMRTRIRTTGPNLESGPHRVPANRPVRLPSVRPSIHSSGPGYSRASSASGPGPRPVGPGIVKNFVLKRCTSGTVYVNNLWVVCGTPHAARDVGFYSLSL